MPLARSRSFCVNPASIRKRLSRAENAALERPIADRERGIGLLGYRSQVTPFRRGAILAELAPDVRQELGVGRTPRPHLVQRSLQLLPRPLALPARRFRLLPRLVRSMSIRLNQQPGPVDAQGPRPIEYRHLCYPDVVGERVEDEQRVVARTPAIQRAPSTVDLAQFVVG